MNDYAAEYKKLKLEVERLSKRKIEMEKKLNNIKKLREMIEKLKIDNDVLDVKFNDLNVND